MHPEGHLHRFDTCLELLVLLDAFELHTVEPCQQVSLPLLVSPAQVLVLQVSQDRIGFHRSDIHIRTGVGAGEKRVAPVGEFATRLRSRTHGHEARQVLVLRPQSVDQPRSEARSGGLEVSQVHHQDRPGMFGDVGVHRMDEAQFVDVLADMREQVADPFARFTVLPETEWAGEQPALGVSQ